MRNDIEPCYGAPGPGKITTLIRRLSQTLDITFLEDNERSIIESAQSISGKEDFFFRELGAVSKKLLQPDHSGGNHYDRSEIFSRLFITCWNTTESF